MLKYLFSSFLLYFYIISNSFASENAGFLVKSFDTISLGFAQLFGNPNVVFFFMFIAFFFGVFSLIKNLLKFAFKNHALGSEKKAINVIAFMISFIGTSGIAFMFNSSPTQFVLFFGGIFGLLIMIVFSFLIMQLFVNMANSVAPKEGDKRKNIAAFWTIIILGSLLVAYLILGFSGKVLVEMGCSDTFVQHFGESTGDGKWSCDASMVFSSIFSLVSTLIQIIWTFVILALIFGSFWWFLLRDPKDSAQKNMSDKEVKEDKTKKSNIKKVEGSLSSIHNTAKRLSEVSETEQELVKQMSDYLDSLDKSSSTSRSPGDQPNGGNR
jgi:hypothetical protein